MAAKGNGLGRVLNTIAVAKNVYVNMNGAEAITFICYKSGGDTVTLSESASASGGSTLAKITDVYTGDGVGGAWTKVTQAAASTYVFATDCVVFTISAEQLSDAKTFLKAQTTSTGTVVAITHDLKVKRTPENLPVLNA